MRCPHEARAGSVRNARATRAVVRDARRPREKSAGRIGNESGGAGSAAPARGESSPYGGEKKKNGCVECAISAYATREAKARDTRAIRAAARAARRLCEMRGPAKGPKQRRTEVRR